jgi:transcriptional regulator with XRE-family HTH domain
MNDGNGSLSKDTLWQDYYANLKGALSSMRRIFRLRAATGLTQDHIAISLNVNKSLVSRRLTGEENFTLKTLSFMASAMRCRLQIRFRPYEEVGEGNNYDVEQDRYESPQGLSGNITQNIGAQPRGIN